MRFTNHCVRRVGLVGSGATVGSAATVGALGSQRVFTRYASDSKVATFLHAADAQPFIESTKPDRMPKSSHMQDPDREGDRQDRQRRGASGPKCHRRMV